MSCERPVSDMDPDRRVRSSTICRRPRPTFATAFSPYLGDTPLPGCVRRPDRMSADLSPGHNHHSIIAV
jgi:hypothetical protein